MVMGVQLTSVLMAQPLGLDASEALSRGSSLCSEPWGRRSPANSLNAVQVGRDCVCAISL